MKRSRKNKENYNPNNQYNSENYNDSNYNDEYGQYNNSDLDNYNEQQNQNYYYDDNNSQQYNYNNGYEPNGNYNEQYEGEYYEEEYEPRKKKTGLIVAISTLLLVLLAVGGYFGYSGYLKNSKTIVDLSQYEVEFVPYGTDGEGRAAADVKKIPEVKSEDSSVKEFLQDPTITYDRNNNLKNGDKVEVTVTLSKATADSKKLELKGEFKRTFTVKGLSEKQKTNETIVIRDNNSNNKGNTNSFREDSSVDTRKLSESQASTWAKAMYIKEFARNSQKSDYTTDVWLGNDDLAYINVKQNNVVKARYRVNPRGQLENQTNGNWYVVSRIYTE